MCNSIQCQVPFKFNYHFYIFSILFPGTKVHQEMILIGEPYKIGYSNIESKTFQKKKLELELMVSSSHFEFHEM